MADAPALNNPEAIAATPEITESGPWPSGWWLLPAVGFGAWFWIKLIAWLVI